MIKLKTDYPYSLKLWLMYFSPLAFQLWTQKFTTNVILSLFSILWVVTADDDIIVSVIFLLTEDGAWKIIESIYIDR